MNHRLIFSLITVILMAGCASEGRRLKSESGYEYEIVRKGSDEPIALNSYVFFYMSLMADDSVWQTTATAGKPSVLKLMEDNTNYGQLKPLVDLFTILHEGDSMLFYFPLDSFGTKPAVFDSITGPLVYHIGIANVMTEAEFEAHSDSIQMAQEADRQVMRDRLPQIEAQANATYAAFKRGDLDSQIKTTDSGLRYIIHEQGDGPLPTRGDQVSVHYYGMFESDAKMFDSSWKAGQPYQFPIGRGQVIQGWEEGLLLLNKGTKATLIVPPSLAYGAAGQPPTIPENATLIFYIELDK